MRTRTVVALAWEGCQVLDVMGPAEVFSVATAMTSGKAYRVCVASLDGGDVVASSGVRIGVETAIGDIDGPIDTLLVPGGFTWPEAMQDQRLLAALGAAAARSRRLLAVCAGAFIAGAAGLLDGRRVTTHAVRRRPRGAVPGGPGGARPDLRRRRERVHLGGRDGEHRSRAGARGGRPRPRPRP
jgi:transcriptional regulator GlxA family with amidase domain